MERASCQIVVRWPDRIMESKKIFFSDRLIKTGKKVGVKGKGKGTLFPYIFHFFNWKCVALDDGKVEERQRVVGQISRGGGWMDSWKPVSGRRTVTWKTGMLLEKWSDESRISIRNCSDYSIEQLVSSQSGSMVVPPLTRRDHKAARTSFLSFCTFGMSSV